MNNFHPGETIRFYLSSCASSSGGIVDPTPIAFTYWPGSSAAAVALTSNSTAVTTGDSSGEWYASVTPTTAQTGIWHYRWSSTGVYPLSQWGAVQVIQPPRST